MRKLKNFSLVRNTSKLFSENQDYKSFSKQHKNAKLTFEILPETPNHLSVVKYKEVFIKSGIMTEESPDGNHHEEKTIQENSQEHMKKLMIFYTPLLCSDISNMFTRIHDYFGITTHNLCTEWNKFVMRNRESTCTALVPWLYNSRALVPYISSSSYVTNQHSYITLNHEILKISFPFTNEKSDNLDLDQKIDTREDRVYENQSKFASSLSEILEETEQMYQQTRGWILFSLLVSSSIVSTFSYPNIIPTHEMQSGFLPSNLPSDMPQLPSQRQERKFAEKPNAIKKVALDDLSNDLETNQISDGNGEGFSWSSLLSMLMQMIFNPGTATGPNKSDGLDDNSVAPSPWANLLAAGLKILTAILGGGASSEGIDKVDNGGSPMQGILAGVLTAVMGGRDPQQVNALAKQAGEFVNILMTLLNALKTSFSHRSIMARNIGRRDSMSEAAVAGITMMKGYVKSVNALSIPCQQKTICEANRECARDIGQSSLFCHLGNYAASYMVDRTSSTGFSVLYEAGRRGRAGENCHQTYQECSEA